MEAWYKYVDSQFADGNNLTYYNFCFLFKEVFLKNSHTSAFVFFKWYEIFALQQSFTVYPPKSQPPLSLTLLGKDHNPSRLTRAAQVFLIST